MTTKENKAENRYLDGEIEIRLQDALIITLFKVYRVGLKTKKLGSEIVDDMNEKIDELGWRDRGIVIPSDDLLRRFVNVWDLSVGDTDFDLETEVINKVKYFWKA